MAAALMPYGFRRVKRGEPADLYIINTCTVTHRADSDNRYLIHRAQRENPDARIVVAGCYVNKDPEFISDMGGVDVLIANEDKQRIAEILPEQLPDLFTSEPLLDGFDGVARFDQFNRSWLKVSDGCNQRCSFCILPSVRGQLVNRPATEIIEEIRGLINHGFHEVVLTGLHLGHYKHRTGTPDVKNLAHLCRLILSETEVGRIRLSSIEPQTVRDELLEVYVEAGDRICRHMHLPLQSGSSRILRLMRRPYDQETYMHRVSELRQAQPDTVIGADIIVGFPGETDEDFAESVKVASSGLLDYLHVFSYSDRPGTKASESTEKVPTEVIKARNKTLKEVSGCIRRRSNRRQIGRILDVIAEHKKIERGIFWGIAGNYTKVSLPFDFEGGRQIVKYLVTSANDDYVKGELL